MIEGRIEQDLFLEWMGWLKINHPKHSFMFDGIVCQDEWEKTDKHILLLLKDYNEKNGAISLDKIDIRAPKGLFDLREHLIYRIGPKNKKNWKVWDNAARWVYGLSKLTIDGFLPFEKADSQGDCYHRSSNLKKVAVVDVKKKPGTSSCNKSKLQRYFLEYPQSIEYTARQIRLYGHLDFILCCGDGVFDICKKILKADALKSQYEIVEKTDDYVITSYGTIVINYIHPLILRGTSKKNAYNNLMKLAHKLLKKIHDA